MTSCGGFSINRRLIYFYLIFIVPLLLIASMHEWCYDEAWTYQEVIGNSLTDLVMYSKFKYANNHIVNSIYFKCLQIAGVSEVFYYRLVSIAGFSLFFYSIYSLLNIMKIGDIYLFPLIIGPYFNYLYQGRGYSLGLGLLTFSILSLCRYIEYNKVWYGYSLVIAGAISSLAIFSNIFFWAAILVVYAGIKLKKRIDWHLLVQFLIVLVTSAYVYYAGKIVSKFDSNIIGSDSIGRNGTISSLISDLSCYGGMNAYIYYGYFKIAVTLCVALLVIGYLMRVANSTECNERLLNLVPVVISVVTLLFMVLAHTLVSAQYPLGRAVFPLEFLILLMGVMAANGSKRYRTVCRLSLLFLFLTTLTQASLIAVSLSKPGLKDVLRDTGKYRLYIVESNPSVIVTTKLSGKLPETVVFYKYPAEVNDVVAAAVNDKSYIYSKVEDLMIYKFKTKKIYECRNGYAFYEIL